MIPKIKKILYATDLSKNSAYAFFYAVDMARKNDGEIVILHSIEPGISPAAAIPPIARQLDELKEREAEAELKEIKKRVDEFCKRMDDYLGASCPNLVSKILVPRGYPVVEILEAADEEGCDTIVLGTHGKGFLKQTFLGSTAAKVLERSRKPVFVIPLPAEKTGIDWDKM
jgi:nucleotide-binding universal stress UspA family protein